MQSRTGGSSQEPTDSPRSSQSISSPSSTNADILHDSQHRIEDPTELILPSSEEDVALMPSTLSAPTDPMPWNAHPPFGYQAPTTLVDQALFFGCGLGTSICYIATLSSLVYFKLLYGVNSFVYLNLAVYLPLLPVSLAQARWDQYYDVQYQSRRTFLVRGIVGFALGLTGTLQMIHGQGALHKGLMTLVINALLQGTGGAILYGTMNQLASFVGSDDARNLKTAVSAGVQASALVVLAASIFTGFGVDEAPRFASFLWSIVTMEFGCFLSFLWLLLARPTVAVAMRRRDGSLRSDDDDLEDDVLLNAPLIASSREVSSSSPIDLSAQELLRRSSSYCWVLMVTLIPSFLVGSWFTRVQTNWMALASWLFYIRIASDFLGRLATIVIPPRNLAYLSWTCLVRLIPVTLFFLNAHRSTPHGFAADFISMILVVIIAFLSGYLVTGCFQLAPMGLEREIRQANVAKQASLLTVAFAISANCGLVSSFALMALGV